jgi:hypothetical protein
MMMQSAAVIGETSPVSQVEPARCRLVRRLISLALGGVVAFHVTMLLIFNLPFGPLTAETWSLANRYVQPIFFQQWNFFAPAPGGWNDFTFVRYRVHRTDGTVRYTKWLAADSIFRPELQRNPLTPLAIDRQIYFALMNVIDNDQADLAALRRLKPQAQPLQATQLPDDVVQLARLMMSLAPTFCFYDSKTAGVDVSMSIQRVPFEHFAERFHYFKAKHDAALSARSVVPVPWIAGEDVVPLSGVSGCIATEFSS